MQKEYQQLLKTDQQDLRKLTEHVEKVERLKKQYTLQKQEIGSLKNVIHELQSENQQLRIRQKSRSLDKKQRDYPDSISDSHGIPTQSRVSQNKKTNAAKSLQISEQDSYPFQTKTKPKIWNEPSEIAHKKTTKHRLKIDGVKQKYLQSSGYPMPSLRNHSGFISSTRKFTSPKIHGRKQTWDLKDSDDNYYSDESTDNLGLDSHHVQTKKNLFDNLISDLKLELEQKQEKLVHETVAHKRTKKQLKKQKENNLNLSEINGKIYTNYQILERENHYLKEQLVKQTELRVQYENMNNDLGLWYNTTAKRIYEEFQLEFIAMDNIYNEFERIHRNHVAHHLAK